MKNLTLFAALLTAAAILTACGGGGSSGTDSAGNAPPPTTGPSPAPTITVTSQVGDSPSNADCARLASDSQSAASLDLSNASIKAVSDLLLAVDATHAYNVFTRRPHDFVNWIVAGSNNTGSVDFESLGVATHETLHMVDTALLPCAPTNQAKYLFFGQQLVTDLAPSGTSAYGIVAETIDPSLTAVGRYQTYIVNNGSNAGNDFRVLLDELAAYTGGAYVEQQYLAKYGSNKAGSFDVNLGGTVTFMVYLENYLKAARLNHPATYTVIQNSASTKAAVQAIWSRAEQVLQASYPSTKSTATPQLLVDSAYFSAAYSPGLLSELDSLGITHASAASWSGTYLP